MPKFQINGIFLLSTPTSLLYKDLTHNFSFLHNFLTILSSSCALIFIILSSLKIPVHSSALNHVTTSEKLGSNYLPLDPRTNHFNDLRHVGTLYVPFFTGYQGLSFSGLLAGFIILVASNIVPYLFLFYKVSCFLLEEKTPHWK